MVHQEENIWVSIREGRLRGTLHWPLNSSPPYPVVIGVHGLLSNRQSQKQIALARRCMAAGVAYLRFDHRGCGESTGDLEKDTSLANRVEDLKAVRDHLVRKDAIDFRRFGLFGSSFGGTVCLAFAAANPVSAVVTLAAPIRSRPLMKIPLEALPGSLPASFRDGSKQFDLTPHIPALNHLLCCHGGADEIVPVRHAHEIEALAGEPKELLIFEGADHRISNSSQRDILVNHSQAWFKRHLAPGPDTNH